MIYLLEYDPSIRKFVMYALEGVGFEIKDFEHLNLFCAALASALSKHIVRLINEIYPDNPEKSEAY